MMTGFLGKLFPVKTLLTRKLPRRQKGYTLIELLIVISLLGVLAAVAIPNIIAFMGRGEQEAKDTELGNIQTAVLAMMMAAEQDQLNASYADIDTEEEVAGVTAGSENLGDYFIGLPYPLRQAYDINQNGEVSVD